MSANRKNVAPNAATQIPFDAGNVSLAPLNVIRTETATSRLPIHNLTRSGGSISIHIKKTNASGETELEWKVSPSRDHGEPRQLAYRLDTLLINRVIDEAPRPLPKLIRLGSLYSICKELGVTNSGPNKEGVKNALLQNAGAFITADVKYKGYDKREYRLKAGFSRYSVILTGETLPTGETADSVYISLNDVYRDVLDRSQVRPLDYDYLKELKPAPQRFYEVISYRIFGAILGGLNEATMLYSDYCMYSAQKRYFKSEQVRPQMASIHQVHMKSGYIRKAKLVKITGEDGTPDWNMIYAPGPKAYAEFAAFSKRKLLHKSAGEDVKPASAGRGVGSQKKTDDEKFGQNDDRKFEGGTGQQVGKNLAKDVAASELLRYFHTDRLGKTKYTPYEKEIILAIELSNKYGERLGKFIIDYALAKAKKTNFHLFTLGGIRQYVDEAVQEYERREAKGSTQLQWENNNALADHKGVIREADEANREAEVLLENLPQETREGLYRRAKKEVMDRSQAARNNWDDAKFSGAVKALMRDYLKESGHQEALFKS